LLRKKWSQGIMPTYERKRSPCPCLQEEMVRIISSTYGLAPPSLSLQERSFLKNKYYESKLKGPFIDRALLRSVDKINAELEKLLNKRRDSSQVGKVPLETTSSEPITLGNQSLDLRSLKLPTKI